MISRGWLLWVCLALLGKMNLAAQQFGTPVLISQRTMGPVTERVYWTQLDSQSGVRVVDRTDYRFWSPFLYDYRRSAGFVRMTSASYFTTTMGRPSRPVPIAVDTTHYHGAVCVLLFEPPRESPSYYYQPSEEGGHPIRPQPQIPEVPVEASARRR